MISSILKVSVFTIACFSLSLSATAQQKPKAERTLKHLDNDKNGEVTLEEFKDTKRKKELSAETLEKRFNRMDRDKSGTITLEEIRTHFKKQEARKAKKAAQ